MKKIVIALTLLFFNSCVMDFGCGFPILNHSMDTIYICFAQYNDIDSVIYCTGLRGSPELKFDETGKIIVSDNDIIFPDSIGYYGKRGSCKDLFRYNQDNKGYFFVIKLETIDNYTWEEICKNKLYDELIVTREMLKENNWKYNYSP